MRQWGDRWAAPAGSPVLIRHNGCGQIVSAVPTCSGCGEALEPRAATAVPGPGAAAETFARTTV